MESFSVIYRNYGHWDICNKNERIFQIRGGPGNYKVINKCNRDIFDKDFKTVNACMGYICDKLMFELIIVEGQQPKIIESWNI